MNAIQSGMNTTPRVDIKKSAPSLLSIKSLSPLPAIQGLLLVSTGIIAPTSLLAEEIRCESESATYCVEKKLKTANNVMGIWTPTTPNSSVLINNNDQVILSVEENDEPGWREFGSLTVGEGTKSIRSLGKRVLPVCGYAMLAGTLVFMTVPGS